MEEKRIGYNDVCEMVGLSRTQVGRYVHELEYEYLGFPKPFKERGRVFFVWSEVQLWVRSSIASGRDAPV